MKLLLPGAILGVCFVSQSVTAATYDCRSNYTVKHHAIFTKQFTISSDLKTDLKEQQFKFDHDGKKYAIDCGIIDQPDLVQNFVCGLNVWNNKAQEWDTTARAVTEVGARMLAVLQSSDKNDFDINCQLRASKQNVNP